MRLGGPLTISTIGHAVLGVVTVASLPYVDAVYEPPEYIPVDVVLGDFEELIPSGGGEPAPPSPTLKPPPPDTAQSEDVPAEGVDQGDEEVLATTQDSAPAQTPADETIITPERPPEDTPLEPEMVEALPSPVEDPPEEEEIDLDAPPPTPRVKPLRPQPSRDALLDLLDERAAQQTQPQPRFNPQPVGPQSAFTGPSTVDDYKKVVRAKMRTCWRSNVDLPNPEGVPVEIRIELNREGSIEGGITVLNAGQIAASGDPFWETARRRAVQAVIRCEPYDRPPEPFEENRFVIMTF